MDKVVKLTPREHTVRARLLAVAIPLFRSQGIKGTGVKQLAQEAQTTAQGLYFNFGSKGGLVVAAIEQWGDEWRQWLARQLERSYGAQPRLLAVFDFLEVWLKHDNYQGTLDLKIGIELSGQAHHPGRPALVAQRAALHGLLEGLAIEAGASDPAQIARAWMMLMDGAVASAMIDRDAEPVRLAKLAATKLLADQLK